MCGYRHLGETRPFKLPSVNLRKARKPEKRRLKVRSFQDRCINLTFRPSKDSVYSIKRHSPSLAALSLPFPWHSPSGLSSLSSRLLVWDSQVTHGMFFTFFTSYSCLMCVFFFLLRLLEHFADHNNYLVKGWAQDGMEMEIFHLYH